MIVVLVLSTLPYFPSSMDGSCPNASVPGPFVAKSPRKACSRVLKNQVSYPAATW
jgi:hypothetical protein